MGMRSDRFPRQSGAMRKRRTRNPEMIWREIPGSRFARPGMTTESLLRRLPWRPGEPQQCIVVGGLDRREIAVRDIVRARRRADVVRDRVQGQVDDLAR